MKRTNLVSDAKKSCQSIPRCTTDYFAFACVCLLLRRRREHDQIRSSSRIPRQRIAKIAKSAPLRRRALLFLHSIGRVCTTGANASKQGRRARAHRQIEARLPRVLCCVNGCVRVHVEAHSCTCSAEIRIFCAYSDILGRLSLRARM